MLGDTIETQTTGPLVDHDTVVRLMGAERSGPSPNLGSDPSRDARKHDDGKLSYSMLPVDALAELVKVYDLGAKKYGRDNWTKGMEWHRVYDGLQRHANAFWSGEEFDPVDGQRHMASVAWAALTLLSYSMRGIGKDDR